MQSLKRDELNSFDENINLILGSEDKLLHTFDVVPLDYSILDLSSPQLLLSSKKLIFYYDNVFEVYSLSELELNIFGESPRFTLWQQLLEGNFVYSEGNKESFDRLKQSEAIVRFAFNEIGQITKEFTLRNGTSVPRNYQTWAMAQIIINQKNSVQSDPMLIDMTRGSFTRFNQKTIVAFVAVFIGYLLLKFFTLTVLPDILDTVFDLLFGVVLVGMLVWLVLSINKTLERYRVVYFTYSSDELKVEPVNRRFEGAEQPASVEAQQRQERPHSTAVSPLTQRAPEASPVQDNPPTTPAL